MRPSIALEQNRIAVREVTSWFHTVNPRVFGSVLHGEDKEGSDLDLLVDPTRETTMMDIGAIRYELRRLLGIEVDVLTPKALPDSFRAQVLAEAVPVWTKLIIYAYQNKPSIFTLISKSRLFRCGLKLKFKHPLHWETHA